MNVKEAVNILNDCDRHELRDHAFGDMEISWTRRGIEIAYGYLDGNTCGVHLVSGTAFSGEDAKTLVGCGTLAHIERNDETGPEDFVPGRIMPGLTREAVKQEVIKQHFFRERMTEEFR